MDSENYEVIYCAEDDGYGVYCDVRDKFCIQRFCKNPSKTKTHIDNIRKTEQLDKSFQVISLI